MNDSLSSGREQGMQRRFYRASSQDFGKIPGYPIAYWVSNLSRSIFEKFPPLDSIAEPRQGLITGENSRFIRAWHEVDFRKIGFGFDSRAAFAGKKLTWAPINKGGGFRRWYGNDMDVVNWFDDGSAIRSFGAEAGGKPRSRAQNLDFYFRPGVTWGKITSGNFSARKAEAGFVFSDAGMKAFAANAGQLDVLTGLLNSSVAVLALSSLSETLNFEQGQIAKIPLNFEVNCPVEDLIHLSRRDWNEREVSWNFEEFPLLHPDHRQQTLLGSYRKLRVHWREVTLQVRRLEEENNRAFIDAYGLRDELTPEVPLNEITLNCNPHYSYGGDKSDEELEALLLADTMRELVSYAVGCMLGRYSLDKPGLILANQGESLADYLEQHRLAQVPQPRFPADDDNVIPVLDGDWFADDITLRFRQFLRVAFGDEHYEGNLAFIEQALNLKGKRNYSLHDHFLSEFYADHVKRYKKRPIYWLFSSPKGSFNALIYMHRYRPDTVSVVLRYLRDFRKKVADEKDRQASASINPAVSQGDRTRALKETDRLNKVLAELDDYEREVIYPLATRQIEIDLDDGVKVNYLKFGAALKKIVGLEAKDED